MGGATALGALAGAATGALAGPPGAAAGAVIGAAMGAAAGTAAELAEKRARLRDRTLDDAIGVTQGDLGCADENMPEARIGAYSAASCGAGGGTGTPSEGPIQALDDG
jgi:hypothetical protein